ncbi:MAG: sulfotransferase family 2 domain-containing protein [Paracoccaceae bacterium]
MSERFDYFVVLADMRTGSNFLETNLNAIDGLACVGEAFNPHFIGFPKTDDIFGVTLAKRDAVPMSLITALTNHPDALCGFRYFHDHDPRVLDIVLTNPRCAKIILTRNPADSYVSKKIASKTGQWKLTNMTSRKAAKITFDPLEFTTHVQDLQSFQQSVLNQLQRSGQTAFYLAYEDLQDVDVLNGLALFLGVPGRLRDLEKTLKVQNPGSLADKVENFEEMELSLAGLDRFNLTRTPNFEPRRGPAVPSFVAPETAPLLFMPVPGGPSARIEAWLAALGGTQTAALLRNMNRKDLKSWKRNNVGHRSFTVLRHPLERAYHTFCNKIVSTQLDNYARLRRKLIRQYNVSLREEDAMDPWSAADHRKAFGEFLVFLKGNLAGQTSLRIDAHWASQTAILQGFAEFALPDVIIREHDMVTQLVKLTQSVDLDPIQMVANPDPKPPFELSQIYDADLEKLAKACYQRDYIMFGFGPWTPL